MDLRKITDTYFAAPQLSVEDVAAAAEQGFTTIISNRPDEEIPPSHHASVLAQEAEARGLAFVHIPVTNGGMDAASVAAHASAIENSEGPVLAFCRSGTRSTVIWAMGAAQNADLSVDAIIAAAAEGGYDLEPLRAQLNTLAAGS